VARPAAAAWAGFFLGVLGCGTPSGVVDDTVTVGRPADAILLDPARVTDGESSEVCEQIFEHLIRHRAGSTAIEPALATSWEVASDGRSITFHLRHDVRFHDGTPMDADAVVFSFDRQRDVGHPHHERDFAYWESTYRNIQRIEKLDEYTIRILIDRPYAPFLANLAMFPASIVSPQAVRRWGSAFARHPVGTGPFALVEWVPGDRIVLRRNPDYWEGPPRLARLVYRAIAGDEERLAALESGAIDVAYELAPKDLGYVALHPDLQLLRMAANNVCYLAMNVTRPPFDDLRVRQAVNHAINKALITRLLYQSLATPAQGPLPPILWGYEPDVPRYPYAPDRARDLLEAARPRLARRPRFYVTSTPRPYLPAPERVAAVIARNLHDIGLDVELVVQAHQAHLTSIARGEHDLCLSGWTGDNGDPDNFLYTLFDRDNTYGEHAANLSFYRSGEVHGLLASAQESSDLKQRERLYSRVQRLIAADAPCVPLAHAEVAVGVRRDLQGLELHPSAMVSYRRAWRVH
jgi:peptide/nickel transport system substrate-binding protein